MPLFSQCRRLSVDMIKLNDSYNNMIRIYMIMVLKMAACLKSLIIFNIILIINFIYHALSQAEE